MNEIERHSSNFSMRNTDISAIIIHTTEGSLEGALSWLTHPDSKVSSHIVIAKTGEIYRLVHDDFRAWHAGKSELHERKDVNAFSLGVELEHIGEEPYPEVQIQSCAQWCGEKANEYFVGLNRIVGHDKIAPGRKTDPLHFSWRSFLFDVARIQIESIGD